MIRARSSLTSLRSTPLGDASKTSPPTPTRKVPAGVISRTEANDEIFKRILDDKTLREAADPQQRSRREIVIERLTEAAHWIA